jgi:hypothetical protein
MPTQEEIDEALKDYDLWDSNGFAAVSQDQIEIAIVTLAAAYRAEKERAAQAIDLYVAAHEAGMKAKHRAELAERQYAEMTKGLMQENCSRSSYWRFMLARHESERKALA